jgi:hypothetical protein
MMDEAHEGPITHPEEMRASFDLRIGNNINLKGSACITPAGIVTAGLMTVAIILATAGLIRSVRR